MKRVCLFNCHFGKLPSWIPFFVKSASTVKTADFCIMTDDPELDEANRFCEEFGFANVRFLPYTVADLEASVSTKLNIDYKMPRVRKICDWKTAYNFLFPTIANKYEFWGHCDLDLIFGDVDSYLSGLLDEFEVISGDVTRLCGPFSIYRTVLGDVFKLHQLWYTIMIELDHVAYDEVGLDQAIKSSNLNVCYGLSEGRTMQNYGSPHLQPPLRIPATWNNGKLTIDEDGRETMFIHMGHKNQITEIDFNNNDKFRITETAIKGIT
ncbi:MAG: hypothetical protein FI729_01210 [SAR202 cluster bacterium]|nr:hypothetical protein [SAR202 cluster bacterium]|tara:strand:+ start:1864 stop:2661 length:798 start_codon:yes stop_codon:yes gene_type:complete